jgi:hypothetical protein
MGNFMNVTSESEKGRRFSRMLRRGVVGWMDGAGGFWGRIEGSWKGFEGILESSLEFPGIPSQNLEESPSKLLQSPTFPPADAAKLHRNSFSAQMFSFILTLANTMYPSFRLQQQFFLLLYIKWLFQVQCQICSEFPSR